MGCIYTVPGDGYIHTQCGQGTASGHFVCKFVATRCRDSVVRLMFRFDQVIGTRASYVLGHVRGLHS